jgi:hypothetical protein
MGAFDTLGMSTPLPSAGICAMMHVLLTLFGRRFLEGAKTMRKLMKANKLKKLFFSQLRKPSPRKKEKGKRNDFVLQFFKKY